MTARTASWDRWRVAHCALLRIEDAPPPVGNGGGGAKALRTAKPQKRTRAVRGRVLSIAASGPYMTAAWAWAWAARALVAHVRYQTQHRI
jgi:hypothetical protein